jgi:hypothetical protein
LSPRGRRHIRIGRLAHRVRRKRRVTCFVLPRRKEARGYSVGDSRFAPLGPIGDIRGGCDRSRCRGGKQRAGLIACLGLGRRRQGGIRKPGHGSHLGAPPERLRRKPVQQTAHVVTISK